MEDNVRRATVRAKRIAPQEELVVSSKTLGTLMEYRLRTSNLSRTGLLLDQGNYSKLPFSKSTILELQIDPDGKIFGQPVNGLAKVVRIDPANGRRSTRESRTLQYGVELVQMDTLDQARWVTFVRRAEDQDKALALPSAS